MRYRNLLRLTVVLMIVALVIAACGGSSEPTKGDLTVYVGAPLSGFQANGGQTRRARQAVGHECRPLFMPNIDVLDAGIIEEGVEHIQEGRADDPEDVPHPLCLQQRND